MSNNTNMEDGSQNKRRKMLPMVDNYSKSTSASSVAEAAAAALAAVTNGSQAHISSNNSRSVNIRSDNTHNVPDPLADVVDPTISGMTSTTHHDLTLSIKSDRFSEAAANSFANQFSASTMHTSAAPGNHVRNLQHTHLHHHLQQQQQQHLQQQQQQQQQISDEKHRTMDNENCSYNSNLLHGLGLNAAAAQNNGNNNINIDTSGHKADHSSNPLDPLQGKKLKSIEYKSPIYKKFLFVPLHNKYWTKSIKDENKYLDFEIQCVFEDNCNWKSTLSSNKGSTTNLRRHLAKAHHVDLKMFDYQNNATGAPQYLGSSLSSQHNNSFTHHINGGANNIIDAVAHGYELMDSEDRYISLQRSQSLVLNFMAKSGLLTSPGYMSNNNLMFDDSLKELVKYFLLADTSCTDWKRQLQLKALSQIDKINN